MAEKDMAGIVGAGPAGRFPPENRVLLPLAARDRLKSNHFAPSGIVALANHDLETAGRRVDLEGQPVAGPCNSREGVASDPFEGPIDDEFPGVAALAVFFGAPDIGRRRPVARPI